MSKKAIEVKATHQGRLHIANLDLPCFVLEDGRRVVSQRSLQLGIGMSSGGGKGGERKIIQFLEKLGEKGLETREMNARILEPLVFNAPNGQQVFGYEATALADLCELVLDARDKIKLTEAQQRIATSCELLMRALAKVGIIALVDEATGYQEVRERLALQKILEKYLVEDYRKKWTKVFPNEFYSELFRIKGWEWKEGSTKRPGVVAKYTNDLVYERLAPGVLEEIKKRNKEVQEETGVKPYQHAWLTLDTGIPALDRHFLKLITIMNITPSKNWGYFNRMVARALPKPGDQIPLTDEIA